MSVGEVIVCMYVCMVITYSNSVTTVKTEQVSK